MTLRCGAGGTNITTTVNEQLAVRWMASVTVQVTGDEPTGKAEPLGGVQLTVTGWVPSLVTGAPYVTTTGCIVVV